MDRNLANLKWPGYVGAIVGTAALTLFTRCLPRPYQLNHRRPLFLLIVLFVALSWGSKPALLASVLGVLLFNVFFLPPLYTLDIAHAQNWVALFAFFTTALAVGQLSARAKRRAEEAEEGRR